jgi:hypothetical protein
MKFAWLTITGSGFDDWVYWHAFTITVDYNSWHIELLLHDVCLTNLYEESRTHLYYSRILSLSLSPTLRPTVSRPVCLGIKHPSGAYDQIVTTVRQLRVCWCGALSPTRGRVCRWQLLLVLASAVIFGSESRRTSGYILLSQIRDFPFHRFLRLAGLRWRYSTPPPHGLLYSLSNSRINSLLYMPPCRTVILLCYSVCCHGNAFDNIRCRRNRCLRAAA